MSRREVDDRAAYQLMLRMRLVDEALVRAWADGLVPGEYHAGIGEEGINAGVLLHLGRDDALALDHRNTAPMIGRGSDPTALLLEVLGSEQGMNGGMAGHMHLIDPDVRAVADGIVGAAGPLAVGLATAGELLRPGSVAIAFHGEAAMNQGMLMEAYNMAVAGSLPVIFVCKDNDWSITTRSADVTAGAPVQRARGFGLPVEVARGHDVVDVHAKAGRLIDRAREGGGPGLLHATCHRPRGHLEGDPIVRLLHDPVGQASELLPDLQAAVVDSDARGLRGRASGVAVLAGRIARAARDWTMARRRDPVRIGRSRLDDADAARITADVEAEIHAAEAAARRAVVGREVFGGVASQVRP